MKHGITSYFLTSAIVIAVAGCSGEQQQSDNGKEQVNQKERISELSEIKANNAIDLLKGENELSLFSEAIYDYGFDTLLLKDGTSFTVIALSDIAVESIPVEIRVKLSTDKNLSRAYISKHIIPQAVFAGDTAIETITLSEDHLIFRKAEDGFFVNDVYLPIGNIKAGKDIVYITDNLIFMPDTILPQGETQNYRE